MRLNYDCIRDLLIYIELNTDDKKPIISASQLRNDLTKYDDNTLNYHLRKIESAGLVDKISYGDGIPQNITWLSWEGHQYLDVIRNDNIWSKTKDRIKSLGSVSLDIIKSIALDFIKSQLGI